MTGSRKAQDSHPFKDSVVFKVGKDREMIQSHGFRAAKYFLYKDLVLILGALPTCLPLTLLGLTHLFRIPRGLVASVAISSPDHQCIDNETGLVR